MPTASRSGSKKPKKTVKKTKKTKKTKTTKKSKKPRTRTVTREVIREVPVYYTGGRVPFMPFQAMDTVAATQNILGYMRGLIAGKNAPNVPRVNPLLVPTNTRRTTRTLRTVDRTRRHSAPTRLNGDRGVAQEIMNDHFGRQSRVNDARTSVFRDIQRDMGVRPQHMAL